MLSNLINRSSSTTAKTHGSPREEIRQRIARAIDGRESVFSVDSKPVKVCQNARFARCAMGKTDIWRVLAWELCIAEYAFGYKLHTLCDISRGIHSYDTTTANVHALYYLKDIKWKYRNCMIMGDKGYLSAPMQFDLFQTANITLDVLYRLNQKKW